MGKNVYLIYNSIGKQVYVNDKGKPFADDGVIFDKPVSELTDVVDFLADNYPKRKGILITNLPNEYYPRFKELVGKKPELKKMQLKRDKKRT